MKSYIKVILLQCFQQSFGRENEVNKGSLIKKKEGKFILLLIILILIINHIFDFFFDFFFWYSKFYVLD